MSNDLRPGKPCSGSQPLDDTFFRCRGVDLARHLKWGKGTCPPFTYRDRKNCRYQYLWSHACSVCQIAVERRSRPLDSLPLCLDGSWVQEDMDLSQIFHVSPAAKRNGNLCCSQQKSLLGHLQYFDSRWWGSTCDAPFQDSLHKRTSPMARLYKNSPRSNGSADG